MLPADKNILQFKMVLFHLCLGKKYKKTQNKQEHIAKTCLLCPRPKAPGLLNQ